MRSTFILGLLLALTHSLSGQSIFDLIAGDQDLREVELVLPLDSILDKTTNKQPAQLYFTDDDGQAQHWPLQVGVRGKFRRRTCALPPLKLDFKKGELEKAGLVRHDKIKLVVPCFDDEKGDELILREYLTYQVYAQLTPYHFRTRLLRLRLTDSHSGRQLDTHYAFIIEDTDEMAERLGGNKVEDLVSQELGSWDRDAEALHSLAQYLIGNHDFSLSLVRNLKQVRREHDQKLIPVGYDFDFCQLVGAPYATINSSVGQTNFHDRVYLGFTLDDDRLLRALTHIDEQRQQVQQLIRHFHYLPSDVRLHVLDMVNQGFHDLRRFIRTSGKGEIYSRLRGDQLDMIPIGELRANFGK